MINHLVRYWVCWGMIQTQISIWTSYKIWKDVSRNWENSFITKYDKENLLLYKGLWFLDKNNGGSSGRGLGEILGCLGTTLRVQIFGIILFWEFNFTVNKSLIWVTVWSVNLTQRTISSLLTLISPSRPAEWDYLQGC